MATDRQRLQATLDDLHAQLGEMEQADPEVRARLQATLAEIQAALAARAQRQPEPESITTRLGEAARHFENSHPNLSGAIGSVIDALGRMGI